MFSLVIIKQRYVFWEIILLPLSLWLLELENNCLVLGSGYKVNFKTNLIISFGRAVSLVKYFHEAVFKKNNLIVLENLILWSGAYTHTHTYYYKHLFFLIPKFTQYKAQEPIK